MLSQIENILRDECKLVKDRPVIVGVSGGPDSLCLMELLRQAGYPVIVAHFNHQLRQDSLQDARTVEKTASKLMLISTIGAGDVRAHAEAEKLSIEEAARNLRYKFMFDLAREHNAQAVAVGHTADDQVETVLMHVLRGTGITGLQGMSYRTILEIFDSEIPIVRPLLDIWREEVIIYCAAHGLRPHYDSTNDSMNFQRNRIRHLLLPTLESYNPKFREALHRMSQSLRSDHEFLIEMVETAWKETVIEVDDDFVTFDFPLLSKCALGLQRNLVKRAMIHLRPGIDVTFTALERASRVLNDESNASRAELKGGLRMVREGGRVYICTPEAQLPFALWPQMADEKPIALEIPGRADLLAGWKFTSERWRITALAKEQAERNEDQFQVWLDADTLPESLELRGRRPGDCYAPLGLDGHEQKLSDFMVNEKMPQRAREHWPLLASGEKIIWVPGYHPGHPYRLTDATTNVIYFSVSKPVEKPS
jgi:tRNA(Ile)-lysidine synthase